MYCLNFVQLWPGHPRSCAPTPGGRAYLARSRERGLLLCSRLGSPPGYGDCRAQSFPLVDDWQHPVLLGLTARADTSRQPIACTIPGGATRFDGEEISASRRPSCQAACSCAEAAVLPALTVAHNRSWGLGGRKATRRDRPPLSGLRLLPLLEDTPRSWRSPSRAASTDAGLGRGMMATPASSHRRGVARFAAGWPDGVLVVDRITDDGHGSLVEQNVGHCATPTRRWDGEGHSSTRPRRRDPRLVPPARTYLGTPA